VKRSARSFAKRAGAPLLGVLDRRFRELAERLERHTSALAADQDRRLQQLDDRVSLDVRVVDEHLLAIQRATRHVEPSGAQVAEEIGALIDRVTHGDHAALVIVAGPGQALAPVPDGFEVARRLSFRAGVDGGWVPVASGEDPSTLRVIELQPRV
jgi:hypothetical protein